MAHQGPDKAYKATVIADALDLPANYLSKVLHELVRARVLTSVRGPTGGYSLAAAPEALTLDLIVAPFQELASSGQCLMGARKCDHRHPCVAHQRWQTIKDMFSTSLQNTTLAMMLAPLPHHNVKPVTLTEVA